MKERLKSIKHVAMDMDGTIYRGNELFPETKPFLALLEKMNISYSFLTNNSSKSTRDYLNKLKKMDILIQEEQMVSSVIHTIDYLKKNHPAFSRIFVAGTESLREQFILDGFKLVDDNPQVVVLGSDLNHDYNRLCKAAYWIKKGCLWLTTHPDIEIPIETDTCWIDCGALTVCLEKVCGCRAQVMGKPNSSMLDITASRAGVSTEYIAMIGDQMQTDIRLARNTGALGVHISSATKVDDDIADLRVANLAEFGRLLLKSKTVELI